MRALPPSVRTMGHLTIRKIRCDGAQPSCYTCTRLQRKCEYERVSEHDNLLSRERKRLSRERKAARIAASTPAHHNPNNHTSENSADEKMGATGITPMHLPFDPKAQSPTFTIPVAQMNAVTQANPADLSAALMQSAPAPEATIPPAWATTQGIPAKEMGAWAVPPTMTPVELGAANAMSPQQDSIASLRSTADPSLLELSAPPASIGADSPSLMSMSWMDGGANGAKQASLSPSDSYATVPPFPDFGQSLSGMSLASLESESTMVDPNELNTTMDTPLKLFSDTPQLPSTMANTPSSVDTNTMSEGGSSVFGGPMSMNFSPLSPQLAPASLDGLEPSMEPRSLSDLEGPDSTFGLYSTSLPAHDGAFPSGGMSELEPSSLPVFSSWTQLTPSNA
ncbi:hypothetical protein GLX27_003076 [Malassezia furfur]|uniref:Zn(2)-C6 fungal-type domain-containing protein n=1 Tax=Malassezia furfur TaxID=55194 RepID=A0ABY8ES61_MALFU|nr:hypothetical protein GLX27_003076 [Malassezia furfur]